MGHDLTISEIPKTASSKFLRSGTYYRAEIRENGRLIAALKGNRNPRERLDEFLAQYWSDRPLDVYRCNFQPWETPVTLRIWKYATQQARVVVNVCIAKEVHGESV